MEIFVPLPVFLLFYVFDLIADEGSRTAPESSYAIKLKLMYKYSSLKHDSVQAKQIIGNYIQAICGNVFFQV